MLAPPREEGVTPARKAARSVAAAAGVVLLAPVVLTLVIDRDRDAAPVTVESVELAAPPAGPAMPDGAGADFRVLLASPATNAALCRPRPRRRRRGTRAKAKTSAKSRT